MTSTHVRWVYERASLVVCHCVATHFGCRVSERGYVPHFERWNYDNHHIHPQKCSLDFPLFTGRSVGRSHLVENHDLLVFFSVKVVYGLFQKD